MACAARRAAAATGATRSVDYQTWIEEVALNLTVGATPEDVLEWYPQVREMLFDNRMSPREAADYIRCFCSGVAV